MDDELLDQLDAIGYELFEQIFCCYVFRGFVVQFVTRLQIDSGDE